MQNAITVCSQVHQSPIILSYKVSTVLSASSFSIPSTILSLWQHHNHLTISPPTTSLLMSRVPHPVPQTHPAYFISTRFYSCRPSTRGGHGLFSNRPIPIHQIIIPPTSSMEASSSFTVDRSLPENDIFYEVSHAYLLNSAHMLSLVAEEAQLATMGRQAAMDFIRDRVSFTTLLYFSH